MRIVLLYPPPWKIPSHGQPPYPAGEGAPKGFDPDAVDGGDFSQAPYGLLSIAAQAMEAGHQVLILNLSTLPWDEVQFLTGRMAADLYGLSCHTANRRGVAMLAQRIRNQHAGAHIVVGGPHVTALARETLIHQDAIDTVVMGEGEASFMELVSRIEDGRPVAGVPGTAWRGAAGVEIGPPRPLIDDLDSLASPADYFSMRTLITSRGCPGRCTFCASRSIWGGRLRFHSVDFVLNMIEKAVNLHGHRYLAVKDDTFTAHRERAMAICEEISRRRIGCYWSCDTRADALDDELLRAMRKAGCRRISIGVESASPQILKNIRKKISPDTVLRATRMARDYGIEVRYYMMVGNRGETYQTFRQSLEFIEKAQPNQFAFFQLHLYPGTEEFEIFRRNGYVTPGIFFTGDFACLTCFAGRSADLEAILSELKKIEGVQDFRAFGIDIHEAVLKRLPELASVHLDLCAAWLRKGQVDKAEGYFETALRLHPPMPGLVHNLCACFAAARKNYPAARIFLEKAAEIFPHQVVVENLNRLHDWLAQGGSESMPPLELFAGGKFEAQYFPEQPEGPGPIGVTAELPDRTG